MGRRLSWLLYGGDPTPRGPAGEAARPRSVPAVQAAAGRVALARTPTNATSSPTTPFGFGPPLEGFVPPYPFDQGAPWWDRSAAMSVPAISRAQSLIVTAVAQLPITTWTVDVSEVPAVERRLPDVGWSRRPDPDRTRQYLLAWTTDDLIFHGIAHWEITNRYAASSGGYPSSFRRIPPGDLSETADGLEVTDPQTGQRRPIDPRDVVEFLSPLDGLLSVGWRTISIAMQLDQAADRFASNEIPNGWLQEKEGSEDLTADELAQIALEFSMARHTATTAALNKWLEYHPNVVDASQLQLVEARQYQALECARIANVPPYLVGAPAGTGMTYLNGQQARQDLVDFGASAYIGCIEQTLSGPNVTPRDVSIRLDLNAWLRNPFTTSGDDAEPSPNDMQIADPTNPEVPV